MLVEDTIGYRIADTRKDRALTVEDVANQLGVSVSALKRWEAGARTPSANRLANLAGILGVSMSWLLTGESRWQVTGDSDGGSPKELEQRVRYAEELLGELGALLVDIRAHTRRLQRDIEEDGTW